MSDSFPQEALPTRGWEAGISRMYDSCIEGLHAIVMSDRGGVRIIKVANDNAPEHALRPNFLPALALHQNQGANSDFQKTKVLICYLNIYQVVQFNHLLLEIKSLSQSVSLGKALAPLSEEPR
ncbi:unnamed protein product [Nyctereutes procyonoides]|uniref:Ragulator complex protein LAMTOR3 n=1 Tax=Nyctereutes procyonoides TaxID=34880 RepID=A0A811YF75_NYCPR|nr:unnamed protein product [Nyctereutes procyonoides]